MGFQLSYMGTKKQSAPAVAEVISSAQPGILLDAFAGMCAVGEAVGDGRQLWNNDVQAFASRVAHALFISKDLAPSISEAADILFNNFQKNLSSLEQRFEEQLVEECAAFESACLESVIEYVNTFSALYSSLERIKERIRLSKKPRTFPYRLFTITYADGYFGLRQCMEIDSIVYAIDQALAIPVISQDQRDWLLLALGQSMRLVANTTGHFAQYLKPKQSNIVRYLKQRRRAVWEAFTRCVGESFPIGNASWRSRNKVFNCDSLDLLTLIKTAKEQPSVVYADPPYTDDQYSRYYHVLETLVMYDYPQIAGEGRYRPDRFVTAFSQKRKVGEAFERLVGDVAAIGADLIVSYPANGLLHETSDNPRTFLNRHYRRVEVADTFRHQHSTFGASNGVASAAVTEVIYWARS